MSSLITARNKTLHYCSINLKIKLANTFNVKQLNKNEKRYNPHQYQWTSSCVAITFLKNIFIAEMSIFYWGIKSYARSSQDKINFESEISCHTGYPRKILLSMLCKEKQQNVKKKILPYSSIFFCAQKKDASSLCNFLNDVLQKKNGAYSINIMQFNKIIIYFQYSKQHIFKRKTKTKQLLHLRFIRSSNLLNVVLHILRMYNDQFCYSLFSLSCFPHIPLSFIVTILFFFSQD